MTGNKIFFNPSVTMIYFDGESYSPPKKARLITCFDNPIATQDRQQRRLGKISDTCVELQETVLRIENFYSMLRKRIDSGLRIQEYQKTDLLICTHRLLDRVALTQDSFSRFRSRPCGMGRNEFFNGKALCQGLLVRATHIASLLPI